MTIPKIIHHIWMGKNTIPDVNLYCAKSVKEVNPDFIQMRIWINL